MSAKTIFTGLAAVATLGFAASVHAAPAGSVDPDTVSVTVSVADLDLGRDAGARVALRRIHSAARGICGDAPDLRLLDRADRYRACIKASVDRTVASLQIPIITALNGGEPVSVLAASP